MVKEGDVADKVYIIREGECKIELSINPLQYIANSGSNNPNKEQNDVDIDLQSRRGLLSQTYNNFLIGTFGKNEWVGNDFMCTGIDEYEYTATAISDMLVYETTKKDISIMPSEFIASFRNALKDRQKWIRERVSSNSKAITSIIKRQENSIEYNDTYHKVHKKYPNASKELLLYIRKKLLFQKEHTSTMPEVKINKDPLLDSDPKAAFKAVPRNLRRERMGSLNMLPSSLAKQSPDHSFELNERKQTMDMQKFKEAEKIKQLINLKSAHTNSSSPVKVPDRKIFLLNSSIAELSLSQSPERDRRLIPSFTQREKRVKIDSIPLLPKIEDHTTSKKLDLELIQKHLKKKFEQKEYRNFIICRRTIEIMDKNLERREKTPNPFSTKLDSS